MLLAATVLVPAAAGLAALVALPAPARRALLVLAALAHAALVARLWTAGPAGVPPEWGGAIGLDALGLVFLSLASLLFLAVSFYAVGYLGAEDPGPRTDFQEGALFANAPEARFISCLLFFLCAMTLVTLARNFGLIWVAVEGTTLASAPLIYFHRHSRSLESTWRYLMICSVGIALALIGNILLSVAALGPGDPEPSLAVAAMIRLGTALDPSWLKAAFIFILIGYGTKMGLAPMHSWLPDAHSEAPSIVSALLSGALLNCAFLGILRLHQVMAAAGLAPFAGNLLVVFGLISMAFAAVFVVGQGDFKRLLAYSSVEHMGILALGVGIGGAAVWGAMLHAVCHSLAKGMLFLLAGNIMAAYRTRSAHDVRGACRVLPLSGPLWVAGFLAIAGSPPFGLFVSEFAILKAAFGTGHILAGALMLGFLTVIFIGMAASVLRMSQGDPPPTMTPLARESAWLTVPPLALAAGVLVLGVYVPPFLQRVLADAAATASALGPGVAELGPLLGGG